MIENAQEFINKIARYFDSDTMSVEVEDGLKIWLRKRKLSSLEMENLYELVIENFAHIPQVNLVAKLWNEQGEKVSKGDSFGKGITVLHDYRDTSWQSIIDRINDIRNAQEHRDLACKEIDMLHEFQELMDVYKMLGTIPSIIMPQKDKDTYLRKVKEDVVNNVPINMEAVRKHMTRRRREYDDKYGAEAAEYESAAQITRTIDNLHSVFDDNAKLFQPEPDRIRI